MKPPFICEVCGEPKNEGTHAACKRILKKDLLEARAKLKKEKAK